MSLLFRRQGYSSLEISRGSIEIFKLHVDLPTVDQCVVVDGQILPRFLADELRKDGDGFLVVLHFLVGYGS
jgi:hypothetical protein